ncbi:sulfurtransferase complex subunit TusB [Stutzerimonas zhaodongensis]|uniref:Sulfurtransferase complex subunit TusB n=1 Tax=Stutzerimonas zhaodongensis TaxID=1176257 RepID=A0A3M2I0S3_9GAMM|nr:sulfurtransferase complex subunit TusB [Stutzerimonas zhaodongensis]MCQ2029986.1 sulfurtransferase complex subunit TusB [Stutzerimonas zhaodongensis]MCQ4314499.1 sulfurtransferase complex subunit TusB [Stutzerimonas zhaodongensis]RMH92017.1 sulfurtransferase complex subunit TusB [Stutzerimonas zhaodongensis]
MATLHLLSHSPFSDSRLSSCLRVLSADDALLLSGDAVYALQHGTDHRRALELMPESIALFALEEDLAARGMDSLPLRLQQVDYEGFVELCCRYDRTNSWL